MVTGVETAGLVLTAFPLLVEVLKVYVDSAEKVKEMWNYRWLLKQFERAIDMERCKFENTWLLLLGVSGEYTDDPEIIPWCETFKTNLLACLRPSVSRIFINACEELNDILEEISSVFRAYDTDKSGYRCMLDAVNFAFKGDFRTRKLARLRELNYDLDNLVNGTRRLSVPVPTPTFDVKINISVAGQYKKVRKHSMLLYSALNESFLQAQCSCEMPHVANLQLEMLVVNPNKKRSLEAWQNPQTFSLPPRFSFLFPLTVGQNRPNQPECKWRQFEFEYFEEPVQAASNPVDTGDYPKSDSRDVETNRPEHNRPIKRHRNVDKLTFPVSATAMLNSVASTVMKKERIKIALPTVRSQNCSNTQLVVQTSTNFSRNTPSQSASPKLNPSQMVDSGSLEPPKKTNLNFRNSASSLPNPVHRTIRCLCSTLREPIDTHSSNCLGTLLTQDSIRHRVWLSSTPFLATPKSTEIVSLAHILSQPSPPIKERLKLGVKLASCVLQLHETEWFSESWGKENIFFLDEESSQPGLEMPLVHQTFAPGGPLAHRSSMEELRPIRCNMSLFSLGIILLELWYWKPLRFHLENDDRLPLLAQNTAKYSAAVRLIDSLYGDAGDSYGDVVRRCIIGIDHKETRLKDDDFKDEAYAKIIQPLEEHLKVFCKASLEEIFKKPVP